MTKKRFLFLIFLFSIYSSNLFALSLNELEMKTQSASQQNQQLSQQLQDKRQDFSTKIGTLVNQDITLSGQQKKLTESASYANSMNKTEENKKILAQIDDIQKKREDGLKEMKQITETFQKDETMITSQLKKNHSILSALQTELNELNTYLKGNSNDSISSLFGSGFSLFLANLNSLNKRMGELRENPNSHGIWARAFTGLQTTKFSNQTNIFYTTIQGGYDYAFGFNEANNYLGVALSYTNAIANYENTLNSNGVELALYNSYVQDGGSKENNFKNGFYNDTIIKLGYNQTNANIITHSDVVHGFLFSISDELGYRFLLGGSKQWYIDPQIELSFGLFNQGKLMKILNNSAILLSQDIILNLRGRIGSNFGYRFDKYTQDKNFRSEIYLGSYFVGDYITGGKIHIDVPGSSSSSNILNFDSTARWTLNLGTNFTIKDHHRIYFDFERSFFGKIITQYQVSLGYRYSFGQSKYSKIMQEVNTKDKK